MPRDSSGNYTLTGPNPYPAQTLTTISSTAFNTMMADLQAAMTDSLDRSGLGGMLVPFTVPDGTVGAPGYAFTNETGSGLWRAGAGDVEMSVLGNTIARWTSTNFFQVSYDAGSTWRTPAYRGAYVVSSSSASFTTASTSPVAVTNLSATIVTTGGAVRVQLVQDGGGSNANFGAEIASGTSTGLLVSILRGATVISKMSLSVTAAGSTGLLECFAPVSSVFTFDPVAAGTYVYSIQLAAISGSTAQLTNTKLVVEEI